jgi:hypothetical protein
MSKEAVSNVSYPVAPGTTVLLTIDCQFGFGAGSWEQVPHADAAVENLRRAAQDTDAFVAQVRALQPAAG